MKYIELTQEYQATVDNEDFSYLNQWKWYYKQGYAARNIIAPDGSRTIVRMHRLLLKTPIGMETDHINHNKLDNRRDNLRIVTKNQNQWNRKKQAGSSQYKGIYWNKQNKRWHVQLQVDGKKKWLGYYANEEDARLAYENGVSKYQGIFGRIS